MVSSIQDGHTLDPNIIAAASIVGAAALISVCLRIVSRKIKGNQLGADDYTILLALVFALGMVANTFVSMHYGLGKHTATLSPKQLVKFIQVSILRALLGNVTNKWQTQWACELLWAATTSIVKISVLLLYLRIFSKLRYMRIAAWTLIAFCALWGTAIIITGILQCRPVQRFWDPFVPGQCFDSRLLFIISTGISVATDVIVLVLPLHGIWGLQMPTSQKFQISGIFLLGGFTCGTSIARFVSMFDSLTMDPTYDFFLPFIWSVTEACIGIVSACLPTMRPLVSASVNAIRSRETGSDSQLKGPMSNEKGNIYIKELVVAPNMSDRYQKLVNVASAPPAPGEEGGTGRGYRDAVYVSPEVPAMWARAELSASREIKRLPRDFETEPFPGAHSLI
ncbi:MAG: hypothetical protein M1820_001925 [Bogoriella megaspora]|nr:MAG: hypothetical protein M1820_001925 [Bogoriella megaspora]